MKLNKQQQGNVILVDTSLLKRIYKRKVFFLDENNKAIKFILERKEYWIFI